MATRSKRTVKRSPPPHVQRRRKEYLELVQRWWPSLTLRDAHDLQPESAVEAPPPEMVNAS